MERRWQDHIAGRGLIQEPTGATSGLDPEARPSRLRSPSPPGKDSTSGTVRGRSPRGADLLRASLGADGMNCARRRTALLTCSPGKLRQSRRSSLPSRAFAEMHAKIGILSPRTASRAAASGRPEHRRDRERRRQPSGAGALRSSSSTISAAIARWWLSLRRIGRSAAVLAAFTCRRRLRQAMAQLSNGSPSPSGGAADEHRRRWPGSSAKAHPARYAE